jgi:hypothetical protein
MTEPHETRLIRPRHLKAVIEAEATGVPFLHWLDADGEQHILLLTDDRPRVTVGRREHCDVALSWRFRASTRCSSRSARPGRWSTTASRATAHLSTAPRFGAGID